MKTPQWCALLILIGTISCDQWTKALARASLPSAPRLSFLYDTIRLHYVENEGGFLGLGDHLSRRYRFWLFTGVNGIVLAWIGLWAWRNRRRPTTGTLGLVLIWSGGLSNLLDRLVRDGRVVDFLNVGVGSLRTGIFNLADLAIVAGVALLVLRRAPKTRKANAA